jgi:hypothetical protein
MQSCLFEISANPRQQNKNIRTSTYFIYPTPCSWRCRAARPSSYCSSDLLQFEIWEILGTAFVAVGLLCGADPRIAFFDKLRGSCSAAVTVLESPFAISNAVQSIQRIDHAAAELSD